MFQDSRFEFAQGKSSGRTEADSLRAWPAKTRSPRMVGRMAGDQQTRVIPFPAKSGQTQWTQEQGDSMRRKRFMKGSVRPRKHGRLKVWVAQWWEDGHRRSKVLGRCSEMTKGQAEVVLNEIVAPLNRTAGHNYVGVYTFGTYLEKVFLPANRGKWKASTRMTTEDRM